MKLFKKISPEQKKWAMTACLLATLSFNLSHLIDGATPGQSDMASKELVAPPAPTEGGVTGLVSSKDPEATPVKSEKIQAPSASKVRRHQGKLNVEGVETSATIVDVGDGKATFVIDKSVDPRKSICATCANGVFTSDINYNNAIEDLTASMEEAEKIIRASAPTRAKQKEIEVDLSTIPVEEMTSKQKDKRADELLAEIENSCGEIEKDETAVKCYSRSLKSMLRDSENKKIFAKGKGKNKDSDNDRADKVEEFIGDNVKEKITGSLINSKFSESAADQIQRLHEALPGKYEGARNMIIEASAEAERSAALSLKSKEQQVARAQSRFEGSKSMQEQARNFEVWKQQANDLNKMKYDFGPKVSSLLEQENKTGLDESVSKNYIDDTFRNQLMDHYNDLTSQLSDSKTGPSDGSLVPTSKTFSETNSNGVKRLQFGQKLQIPGGVNLRQNMNNNARAPISNQAVAPNSFNNTLQQQQQQNNGSFGRPPAPQLTPSTGAVGTNVQPTF